MATSPSLEALAARYQASPAELPSRDTIVHMIAEVPHADFTAALREFNGRVAELGDAWDSASESGDFSAAYELLPQVAPTMTFSRHVMCERRELARRSQLRAALAGVVLSGGLAVCGMGLAATYAYTESLQAMVAADAEDTQVVSIGAGIAVGMTTGAVLGLGAAVASGGIIAAADRATGRYAQRNAKKQLRKRKKS